MDSAVSAVLVGVGLVVGVVMVLRQDRIRSASLGPRWWWRRAARAALVGGGGLGVGCVVGGGGALLVGRVVDGSVVGVELARDHFRRLDRLGSIVLMRCVSFGGGRGEGCVLVVEIPSEQECW